MEELYGTVNVTDEQLEEVTSFPEIYLTICSDPTVFAFMRPIDLQAVYKQPCDLSRFCSEVEWGGAQIHIHA